MRKIYLIAITLLAVFVLGRLSMQDPRLVAQEIEPSCVMCPSAYISAEEIEEYQNVAIATGLTDQQVRSIDIGKANVQIALVHRGALEQPGARSVAEHSLVTEVYYVLSGSGTNVTGPDLLDKQPRSAGNRAVQFLNGPGHNATGIRNSSTHELTSGDVFIIPAGTGHQFTRIDDHITYLMVRVDPDKVVPLMDEAASQAYLAEQAN